MPDFAKRRRAVSARGLYLAAADMNTFTVYDQTFVFNGKVGQSFTVYHHSFLRKGRHNFFRGHTVADGIECWEGAASMVAKIKRAVEYAEVRLSSSFPCHLPLLACVLKDRARSRRSSVLQWLMS